MATIEEPADARPGEAAGVRLPRRRRGRRHAQRRARRHGRQARPLPRAGRRRAALRRPSSRARTGTAERYVREWLNAQAAGGYVEYDADSGRYTLPPEQAIALTDESSPAYLPGFFQIALGSVIDSPRITEAARTRRRASAGTSTSTTCTRAASGSSARLQRATWSPSGCRRSTASSRSSSAAPTVADVGCGHGASTILMAQAFPNSTLRRLRLPRRLDRDRAGARAGSRRRRTASRFEARRRRRTRATATTS